MQRGTNWFHQSVIAVICFSIKITSWGFQKIHIDYNKVLNHSYIIILHLHYNIVACRRTFGHDVTKRSQLQAPPPSRLAYPAHHQFFSASLGSNILAPGFPPRNNLNSLEMMETELHKTPNTLSNFQ